MIVIDNRSLKITFRVNEKENKQIIKRVQKANMTISEYARYSSLNKEIIVLEGIDELAKEIRAIGRNLNQLTILCHQGKITCPNIGEVERKLDEIWQLLSLLTVKMRKRKG